MLKKILLWGSIAILLIVIVSGFALYQSYQDMLSEWHVDEDQSENTEDPDSDEEKEPKEKLQEPFALLLYGIDQRMDQDDTGRPDTLMLALVDPEELKVKLISIPRDSYVEKIPGELKKINQTFSIGGVEYTIETIEEWLDIPIKGYVSIDFNGFIELVDLVGGVDVYVDRTIRYYDPADGTNINLDEGQQVLDGKNALDFVRARKDNRGSRYYTSDYLRMERQQRVLKALGHELLSVRSLTRIFNMMDVVGDNVSTTLKPKELDRLIRSFYKFDMENLETTSIEGEGQQIGIYSYEMIPQAEIDRIHELVHHFLDREPLRDEESSENADSEQADADIRYQHQLQ
ncbi:LCP family protein [Caldalkalibacillus salinus]|uniref:LCP family protein n=1 Tax=Caldalkalibacillus salinus TaxID=2803787 RepID=UPI001920E7F5|nr:LCP family protein [Caldalkalibacillus salinus]